MTAKNKACILKPMSQIPLFSPLTPASWTVTDLTRYLRELLESDELLQDVWVQGEVSNISHPASGHLYFTLKDSSASLRCVMWRNAAARQNFIPRDGDAIEVHGAISVYEAGGQYQLYADLFRPAGEGALYQEFLRLKALLEAEGLFAPERKRPIPSRPQRIGVVTSRTGAVLHDILNTLRRRYPLVEVVLAPTAVQGVDAPPAIIAALRDIVRLAKPDVIILARGGGSIEDLWAFNDEQVARAIAASPVPIIAGIGHETDFTIADFVADLRAPTPTAAAELATPNQADLRIELSELGYQLNHFLQAYLSELRWTHKELQNNLARNSPLARINSDLQRVDEFNHRLISTTSHILQLARSQLTGLAQHIAALNPAAVLERGYAIVTNHVGQVISRVAQVSQGESLNVQVSDGDFDVRVD
ncbi:MAG TPA: exodeoxyribonuclease VII large subunit [Anaerolineales bacterium]